MTARKSSTKKTFESSLQELEKIVAEMESGELSLDKMMARFESGQSLLKSCESELNEVQRKIEILVKQDNKLTTEPFGNE